MRPLLLGYERGDSMNAQMKSEEKATECAACGRMLSHLERRYGLYRDFCSDVCLKIGRAYCKGGCGTRITQPMERGRRKNWCGTLCRSRYRRLGTAIISRTLLEEWERTTCKSCGGDLVQPERAGAKKQFCKDTCKHRYYRTQKRGQLDILQKWGTFAPETRKEIIGVEQCMGIGAANRLTTAISREYVLRRKDTTS